MHHPPVSLEALSEQEKDKMLVAAKKRINQGVIFYLVPFVVFGYAIFYVNNHYMGLGLDQRENLRSFINVLMVIGCILPARLFVNTVLRYRKSANAWQKKVFRGKIQAKEGRTVTIANQRLKLTTEMAAQLKVDDEVILAVSTVDQMPLSLDVLGPKS